MNYEIILALIEFAKWLMYIAQWLFIGALALVLIACIILITISIYDKKMIYNFVKKI